jgi:hypothetical protein
MSAHTFDQMTLALLLFSLLEQAFYIQEGASERALQEFEYNPLKSFTHVA